MSEALINCFKFNLSSMDSSVITPEDVLESLMNDGTIDAIRLKIINQLKANVSLFSIYSIINEIFIS